MAKSTEQQLEEQLVLVMQLAKRLTGGKVTSISVDATESGEYPFRMEVPDETLPLVGVARQS